MISKKDLLTIVDNFCKMRLFFIHIFSAKKMNVDSLWTSILGEIELEVSRANFAAFFKGTSIKNPGRDRVFEIGCPNSASLLMLKNRFFPLIVSTLEKRLNKNVSLRFVLEPPKQPATLDPGPLFSAAPNFEDKLRKAGLNPTYTFDNFAVSETNQMAHAAIRAVSQKPGKAYNPLFIWGTTGVGKTHLLQALGREIILHNPNHKVIYCTGEEFTNGIIEAISLRSTHLFKKKYRTTGIFLVDDVQFIAGREAVQMEFFHTFNSIVQFGGQVVLTSDRPPKEISKLEERLRSRFEGGLIVDVSNPTFELRTAIILIKASERKIALPIDAAKSLAAAFEDTRALEGALLRYLSEKGKNDNVDKIISKITSRPFSSNEEKKKKTAPEKLLEVFSSHFEIKQALFRGPRRKKQIAEPRQLLMFVLRQDMGLPFEEIGLFLGGRDHSTIIYGVEKIASLLPKKENLRSSLSQIRKLLWG